MVDRQRWPRGSQPLVEWKCFVADGGDWAEFFDHMHNAMALYFVRITTEQHRGPVSSRSEAVVHDGIPGQMVTLLFKGRRSQAARMKQLKHGGFGFTDPSQNASGYHAVPLVILPPEETFEPEPEEADEPPEEPIAAIPTTVMGMRAMAKRMNLDVSAYTGAGCGVKIRAAIQEVLDANGRPESRDN